MDLDGVEGLPPRPDSNSYSSSAIAKALIDHQRLEGEPCQLKGSWDPVDPWSPDGGRIYATAMATLALEAPECLPRAVFGERK